MRSEFQAAIAQLIAEKGLPREVVMETVATALRQLTAKVPAAERIFALR